MAISREEVRHVAKLARLALSDEELAAIDAEVTAEVEASVEFAKAGTDPDPEDALKYVYA